MTKRKRRIQNDGDTKLRTLSMRSRTLPSKLQPSEYFKQNSPIAEQFGLLTPDESPAKGLGSPIPSESSNDQQSPPAKPFKAALQQLLNGAIKPKLKQQHQPLKNTKSSIPENSLNRQQHRLSRLLTNKSRSYLSAIIPTPPESTTSPGNGTDSDQQLSSSSNTTPDSIESKVTGNNIKNNSSLSCKKNTKIREEAFYKSLQPRRLLEWSDEKNDFLTLQNYMSSLKVRKHKIKLEEKLLDRHEELESRMRSILLDWLMEVCDCFHLQRSTFYLAQYYIDAYISVTGTSADTSINSLTTPDASNSERTTTAICSPLLSSCPATSTTPSTTPNNKTSSKTPTTSSSSFENETSQSSHQVSKTRLQLLGISALFLASKIEEIDPPRLARFSYITDGACTDEDICLQELDILQTLNWVMNPVTVYDWLRLYLQTTYHYLVRNRGGTPNRNSPRRKNNSGGSNSSIKEPSLSQLEVSKPFIEDASFTPMVFAQMCQLLDLATLDVNCLKWQPYELAAGILYHFSSQNTATRASNISIKNLVECVYWLTPMAEALKDYGLLKDPLQYSEDTDDPRNYRKVPPSQWYNLQFHESMSMELLEQANKKRSTISSQSHVKRCRTDKKTVNDSTGDTNLNHSSSSGSSQNCSYQDN